MSTPAQVTEARATEAIRKERDRLRAQVAIDEKAKSAMLKEHFRDVDEIARLRAEVRRLTASSAIDRDMHRSAVERAERAEAELAKERARLDYVLKLRCADETREDIDDNLITEGEK